jgi:hypothetical protein
LAIFSICSVAQEAHVSKVARSIQQKSRRPRQTIKIDHSVKLRRSRSRAQCDRRFNGDWNAFALPFADQMGDLLMSSQQRLYPRQRPDGRLSRTAKIVSAPKAPVIECILIDYSAGGACLQLQKHADLPPRFEVIYGTTRKRCRLVWKRAMRVGVAF